MNTPCATTEATSAHWPLLVNEANLILMKKAAVIGSSALGIEAADGMPVAMSPEGRMLHTSVRLARRGDAVTFVSEAARDRVGDLIVDYLSAEGVVTSSIDRYAGGHTPLNLHFLSDGSHPQSDTVRYRVYPEDTFDAVWPRIDRDDIVVMGDYFAVSPRNIKFVREFVGSCRQRRAVVVYAPGFAIHGGKQFTPVKPSLLDNLELADFVVATEAEMREFFGSKNLAAAYRDSISFYCHEFIGLAVDSEGPGLYYFSPSHTIRLSLPDERLVTTREGNAVVIAAIVHGIMAAGIGFMRLAEGLNDDERRAVLEAADVANLSL